MPFQKSDPAAIEVVQFILESCLLRRDKTMRDVDGKLIVELPEKVVSRLPPLFFFCTGLLGAGLTGRVV